jgi:hypothetical protein
MIKRRSKKRTYSRKKTNKRKNKLVAIMIQTGYTGRLIKRNETNTGSLSSINAAVIFSDKYWGKGLKPLIYDNNIYKLVKKSKVDTDGCVVFKASNISVLDELYQRLVSAEYCSMYGIHGTKYVANGKILLVKVDSESG